MISFCGESEAPPSTGLFYLEKRAIRGCSFGISVAESGKEKLAERRR
jgi:hypothetical protein